MATLTLQVKAHQIRLFCPYATHIWSFSGGLNGTNQICSNPTQVTSVCGTESDTYLMFLKAAEV